MRIKKLSDVYDHVTQQPPRYVVSEPGHRSLNLWPLHLAISTLVPNNPCVAPVGTYYGKYDMHNHAQRVIQSVLSDASDRCVFP